MREIRQGQFYRHFKGRMYQIVAVAEHSETGEQMVVYQALYGDYRVYVRPYEMFVSEVDHEKYPDAAQKHRFELADFQEPPKSAEREYAEPGQPGRTVAGEPEKAEEKLPEAVPEEAKGPEEGQVNPILLKFLDADTYQEKMHILAYYRNQMDENLLNNIAISLDVVVEKKNLQDKYDEIMNCLSMMERFEVVKRRR